jgi:hypothetical protein
MLPESQNFRDGCVSHSYSHFNIRGTGLTNRIAFKQNREIQPYKSTMPPLCQTDHNDAELSTKLLNQDHGGYMSTMQSDTIYFQSLLTP